MNPNGLWIMSGRNPNSNLFDEYADTYDQWFGSLLGKAVLKAETDLILNLLKPAPGEAMLDAGCGTGLFTSMFLGKGIQVTGLDISPEMLAKARKRLKRGEARFVHGDIQNLPFYDESFDHVLSITTIEFVPDASKAINECFRVLKQGGTLVVATLNRWGLWAWKRNRGQATGKSVYSHATFRTRTELSSLGLPRTGIFRTAVHFAPCSSLISVKLAPFLERAGTFLNLPTGALVVGRWTK